ncbi:Pallidin [Carabus blaptoides fortunei]
MSADNLNANNIQDNTRIEQSVDLQENCFTNDTVTNLTTGVLEIYQPHLKKVQSQLHELTIKQKVLIEQLHNENLKLAWSQNSSDYQEMFKTIQIYRDKLVNIKKDMRTLHEKSTKLKKRALRLQQLKERDEAAKMQRRQREQDLIAK